MVLLYEHPLSPYAQKVKIALAEMGVAFERRLPSSPAGRDDAFAAASPRLEVPARVAGEPRVFDSPIILGYVEDPGPAPPLPPAPPAERARVRMLEELCDTYVEPISWAAMEIRVFKRATGALAERLLARGAEQAAGVQRYLERQLADRPWFNGAAFGWGDLSVVPYVQGHRHRRHPAPGGHASRRLARAGEHAAERRRRLRGRGREHAGLQDAPAARRVRALQARVPRPPPRVDGPQRGDRHRPRRHAQGQHPLRHGARLRRQLPRRTCFQG